jgi:hypothetical protein
MEERRHKKSLENRRKIKEAGSPEATMALAVITRSNITFP